MMKKKLSLLLFSLSFIMQSTDTQFYEKINQERDYAESIQLKRCGCDQIPCQRGKQGKKGPRGPRGRAGENACGMGELFLNAPMMASSGEGGGYPPDSTFIPYTPVDTFIPAWTVLPSSFQANPVEGIFNIPVDLDRTQPVTVVMHFLVESVPFSPAQARIRVDMIYLPNNDLLGFIPSATGYDDTQFSTDFLVTPAIPVFSSNLRQIAVSVVLDPTKINGEWAFIGISRVATASAEFDAPLYLSTISVQYNRICSE